MAGDPSLQRICMAALARMLAILLSHVRGVGIEDDTLYARERHEALSSSASDERQSRLAGELYAPAGEARAGDEHGDAHLYGLDDHLGGQTPGGVEDFVIGADAIEEHVAGDLVDGVVTAHVLQVDQRSVLFGEDTAVDGAGLEIEARGRVDLLGQLIEPGRAHAGVGVEDDLIELLHQISKDGAL